MMKSILILALIFTFAFSSTLKLEKQLLRDLWEQWKLANEKVYVSAQEDIRFNIFAENYLKILEFNALNDDITLGLNDFADLTLEEYKSKYLKINVPADVEKNRNPEIFSTTDLPKSVDWRQKGAVTPARKQGGCGACWAFSAIASLESRHYIDSGNLESFSEQNLLDCARGYPGNSSGCLGGWMTDAFSYTAEHGIQLEADYPYTGFDGECKTDKSKTFNVNRGYKNVTANNAEQLKAALVEQPVSVAVNADNFAWMFYRGGVIKRLCMEYISHAITAVGYDDTKGTESFIAKNSFGPKWGDNGFVYISTDGSANKGKGVCGILQLPSYPTSN